MINRAVGADTTFYRSVLKILSISSVSVAIPFAIYHLFLGHGVVFLILLPVIVIHLSALYLLVRRQFSPLAAYLVATVQIAAATSYVHYLGAPASYWVFASAVANFYIVRWPLALLLNLLSGVIVAMLMRDAPELLVRFLGGFALLNLFLCVYSRQFERVAAEADHLMHRDPLTGAANRLALDKALKLSTYDCDRNGTPATLLMLDLDHYKRINDHFGHTVGDQVLKDIAQLIQQRLRLTDGFFRFGGEEFIVLAANTRLEEALSLAEDIRSLVGNHAFPPTNGVTLSIGLAELHAGESPDEWLRRADEALYEAKHAGRNRVEESGPEISLSPTSNPASN